MTLQDESKWSSSSSNASVSSIAARKSPEHKAVVRSHSEPQGPNSSHIEVVSRARKLSVASEKVGSLKTYRVLPQNEAVDFGLSRYKTELCRAFEETGCCKYGEKCQFAHGVFEKRDVPRHPKYKTELCRCYHSQGFCSYGQRCHFVHEPEEAMRPMSEIIEKATFPIPESLTNRFCEASAATSSVQECGTKNTHRALTQTQSLFCYSSDSARSNSPGAVERRNTTTDISSFGSNDLHIPFTSMAISDDVFGCSFGQSSNCSTTSLPTGHASPDTTGSTASFDSGFINESQACDDFASILSSRKLSPGSFLFSDVERTTKTWPSLDKKLTNNDDFLPALVKNNEAFMSNVDTFKCKTTAVPAPVQQQQNSSWVMASFADDCSSQPWVVGDLLKDFS